MHLSSLLTDLRQQNAWLQQVPVVVLRGALQNLDRAFQNFFAGRGNYPRFKHRNDPAGINIFDAANIGWVRFREHRQLEGKMRTVSLSREGKHWYISFTAEGRYTLPNAQQPVIGIDRGIAQSVTLSTGEAFHLPVAQPKEEARLRWLQRHVARQVKGSNRRRRTLAKAAKLKAGLNRSLLANALSDFERMLTYKCERTGARLLHVHPADTSQTCSRCGHRAADNRESQAVFRCVRCGHNLNADHNAALNILSAAGSAVAAQGGSGTTPADELRTRPRARAVSAPSGRRKTGLSVIY